MYKTKLVQFLAKLVDLFAYNRSKILPLGDSVDQDMHTAKHWNC